jgi:lysophospholipase L1-like esterase
MTGLSWVLAAAVLLLLSVAAELAARWWLRHRGPYYVFPPGLRLRLHPDRDVFPQCEPVVRFDINSAGERGGEVPRLRANDSLYRAIVAGGSQPEGYLLDQDTSWPGALERLLQRPENLQRLGATKVHVGSIGRSGAGSEAVDLIFERVLDRYPRLQAIIVLVGVSDVFRWLEQGAPPTPPPPVRTSDVFMCHPEAPFGWKPRELALVEVCLRMLRRWLRPVHVHERAGSWVGRARAMRARAKEIRTTMPDPAPMLRHFETHFRRLLQRAMAHADRVLVVRQPWFDKDYSPEEAAHMWHGGVGQAWCEEITTYYSFEVVSGLMALLDATAARVATELDVEQLDLMPILERSLNTYYDWLHLSPGGARAVAVAVAHAILRQPLPSGRGPDRPGGGFSVERSDDRRRPMPLTAVVSSNASRGNGARESQC